MNILLAALVGLRAWVRSLFSCRHRQYSRVFTRKEHGTQWYYVVCESCRREVRYDWHLMKVIR